MRTPTQNSRYHPGITFADAPTGILVAVIAILIDIRPPPEISLTISNKGWTEEDV